MMDLSKFIGNKIKEYRERRNLTQEDLADMLNTTRQSISRYETGERKANQDMLFKLSEIYEISINDFFPSNSKKSITTIYNELEQLRQKKVYNYAEEQLESQKQAKQSNVIPLNSNNDPLTSFDWYGHASAVTGEFLDGNENKTTIQLPKKDIPQNADFALTVNGDSMKPVFKNHEMIFVERTTDLPSGSIGIVVVDGEAFIKKIYINDDCMTLVSLNPKYEDKVIKDAQFIKVIGHVII
ncbi:repressor protein [Melissococcus plutonius ATCC 35311]|uniref:Repressor protein n=2 Tax=Melissococcus plutonius TaxID=33970 RepID=F3YBJ7_MELPT|nr:repressor protein [Melissococcus plutonius ATCC 35311]